MSRSTFLQIPPASVIDARFKLIWLTTDFVSIRNLCSKICRKPERQSARRQSHSVDGCLFMRQWNCQIMNTLLLLMILLHLFYLRSCYSHSRTTSRPRSTNWTLIALKSKKAKPKKPRRVWIIPLLISWHFRSYSVWSHLYFLTFSPCSPGPGGPRRPGNPGGPKLPWEKKMYSF